MNKMYCRFFQQVLRLSMPLMPWRKPELLEGEGSLARLPELLKKENVSNALVVTDKGAFFTRVDGSAV